MRTALKRYLINFLSKRNYFIYVGTLLLKSFLQEVLLNERDVVAFEYDLTSHLIDLRKDPLIYSLLDHLI